MEPQPTLDRDCSAGEISQEKKLRLGILSTMLLKKYQPSTRRRDQKPSMTIIATGLTRKAVFCFLFSLFPYLVEFVSTRAALLCKVCQ